MAWFRKKTSNNSVVQIKNFNNCVVQIKKIQLMVWFR